MAYFGFSMKATYNAQIIYHNLTHFLVRKKNPQLLKKGFSTGNRKENNNKYNKIKKSKNIRDLIKVLCFLPFSLFMFLPYSVTIKDTHS